MIQSNAVSAMLLIPKTRDVARNGTAKGILSRDDSFMNMLNKRIADRNNNSIKGRTMGARNNMQRSDIIKDNAKPVYGSEARPEKKKLNDESKDIAETSKPEVKGKPKAEDINNEKGNKERIEEKINSLEALLALLEELMARLNIKNVSADPLTPNTSQELMLSGQNEAISPMELLMALVEGNAAKLKTLMNELGNSEQTPEITDLMEKTQGLIGRLNKDQNTPELKAEIIGESISKGELIGQLKAQCGQLIDKLNEQVSKLNATLNKEQDTKLQADPILTGVVPEETVLNEHGKAESKTQDETKDTMDDSAAFAKDVYNSTVKAGAEIENPFESIIIQNQQTSKENLIQQASIEKTQFPLSEKPLAHTVTNQVTMKVKLMAGENKQEMEMHLKPDSLGKLSLKIIHERGEILAKITAENQQVKGILESNMQMLKDALEKSGFNVQNLSVSVGNGNENGKNRENKDGKGRAQTSGFSRVTSNSSRVGTDKIYLRARIEKEHFAGTSQINLTA